MTSFLLFVVLFVGSWFLIYFSADAFVDGLKDLAEKHAVSPFILGLLVLGVDPEESVASIVAALEGLPHVAVGNVVGNTVIALTVTFGLPALFYNINLDSVPRFYLWLLLALTGGVVLGCYIPGGLLWFGLLNLGLFGVYLLKNLRAFKRTGETEVAFEVEGMGGSEGSDTADAGEVEERSDLVLILKTLAGLALVILGGFGLILATENIIVTLGVSESFFGFIVIAFATNVEELFIIVVAIRKNRVEIGVGAEIGKVVWNLAVTFGVSGLILLDLQPTQIYAINLAILVLVIAMFAWVAARRRLTKAYGVAFLGVLALFVFVNFALGTLAVD
ncbi:MAG: sodium:calcium antiporter [Promethearchaeota archaeon]